MADTSTNADGSINWGALGGSLVAPAIGVAGSLAAGNQASNTADKAFGQQQQYGNAALNNLTAAQGLTNYALPKLTTATPDIADMPGYQFGLNQGQQGLDRGFAAKGGYDSGARMKAGIQYNQDYANSQYGNYFNRENSLLQTGLGATNNANSILTGIGNAGAASNIAKGNAQSSGTLGAAQSLASYLGYTPTVGGQSNGGAIGSALSSYLSSLFGNGATPANNTITGGVANYNPSYASGYGNLGQDNSDYQSVQTAPIDYTLNNPSYASGYGNIGQDTSDYQ